MLLRRDAYKSCIVQSYAGFEAFLSAFVEEKLLCTSDKSWKKATVKQYISGPGRDRLAFTGLLRVIIDEVLEIRIVGTHAFKARISLLS